MTELNRNNLEELVRARKRQYENVDDAVAAYNRELELSKEYNGRQLLEMIQNADDAGAKTMRISLDYEKRLLIIDNDGEPFSYEGIKSIMIANLSSKITTTYIGNKGLGFRSVLFWADEIVIRSGNLEMKFSENVAKKTAMELGYDLDKIQKEHGLSNNVVPFPILGIPEISTCNSCFDRGCQIRIRYKEQFFDDIQRQIDAVDGKTLLFLNHVENFITDNKKMSVSKDGNKVCADDKSWLIEQLSNDLPDEYQDSKKNERKKYGIKIAIPIEKDENSYFLYNYLPTQERISLPYIIHATLELDSSRNRINDAEVNRYILKKIGNLVSEHVKKMLEDESKFGWEAYRFMTPMNPRESTSMIMDNLYSCLRDNRDSLAIYPTITGNYVTKDDYFYIGIDDCLFWKKLNIRNSCFDKVLLPFPNELSSSLSCKKNADIVEALNQLSESEELTIDKRVSLINHLVCFEKKHNNGIYDFKNTPLYLLLDQDGNVIRDDGKVFTPPMQLNEKDVHFDLPDYVRLQFVNHDLYQKLVESFEDIKSYNPFKNKADKFCNDMGKVCKVSSYDLDEVLQVVVSQTREELRKNEDNSESIVKKMVSSLFSVFRVTGFGKVLESVRLIDDNGSLVSASSLFLPTQKNYAVFGENVRYLKAMEYWNLDFVGENEYNEFFKHLGVNMFFAKEKEEYGENNGYFDFLESLGVWKSDDVVFNKRNLDKGMRNLKHDSFSTSLSDVINKLDLSQLLLLICSEPILKEELNKKANLFFKQYQERYFETEYTYIRYMLCEHPEVKNIVFASDVCIGASVDWDLLNKFGVDKELVEFVLSRICTIPKCMKDEDVVKTLNRLEQFDPKGNMVKKVYRLFIDSFSSCKRKPLQNHSLRLFAKDSNGQKSYCDVSSVFYSDNTCIPHKILEKKNLKRLDYPDGRGTEKVCNAFGLYPVNDEIQGVIQDSICYSCIDGEFGRYFENLKPFFLLEAVKNIKKDKSRIANRLKKCSIHLVKRCLYKMKGWDDDEELFIEEFVNEGDDFYLNVGNMTLLDLKGSFECCNAIAEILNICLRVETENNKLFVELFRDPDFWKKDLEKRFSEDEIKEVHYLLGLSNNEMSFWKKVFSDENITLMDADDVHQKAKKEFGMDSVSWNRIDFENWNTKESIGLLRKICDKTGQKILDDIDLSSWHEKRFKALKDDKKDDFVSSYWCYLKDKGEIQSHFIDGINEYDEMGFDMKGFSHSILEHKDYLTLYNEKIRERFGFDVHEKQYEPKKLYPLMGKEDNEMPNEIRSLLYFEGNEEKIKSFLEKNEEITDDFFNSSTQQFEDEYELTFVDFTDIEKTPIPISKKKNKGLYRHSDTERNMVAGEKAERRVKLMLEKEGWEYKWVSGYSDVPDKNDALGYDFKYKKNEDEEWRLLEVKSVSNNKFILSSNEYKEAKENKDKYDIAMVHDEKITIISGFFKGDFSIEPNDYVVCFVEKANNQG